MTMLSYQVHGHAATFTAGAAPGVASTPCGCRVPLIGVHDALLAICLAIKQNQEVARCSDVVRMALFI